MKDFSVLLAFKGGLLNLEISDNHSGRHGLYHYQKKVKSQNSLVFLDICGLENRIIPLGKVYSVGFKSWFFD